MLLFFYRVFIVLLFAHIYSFQVGNAIVFASVFIYVNFKICISGGLHKNLNIYENSDLTKKLKRCQKLSICLFHSYHHLLALCVQNVMTVWSNTSKKKLRQHYLTMYLRDDHRPFYDLYCDEERSKVIGFSTFCDLCPKNVLLLGSTPRDQCKCMIHENFFLKLNAMDITYDR